MNSGGDGIAIEAPASGNVVQGNFIGVYQAMKVYGNGGDGIHAENGGGNMIGGSTNGAGNVIYGNLGNGVETDNDPNDVVQGNIIGEIVGGQVLSNHINGIVINGGANTQIGGTQPGASNTITANGGSGVVIANSTNDPVQDNTITFNGGSGVVITSSTSILVQDNTLTSNGASGVALTSASSGNLVQGNTITFNGGSGVVITRSSSNQAQDNRVLNNTGDGFTIDFGSNNTIGGPAPSNANIISGNQGSGIQILGDLPSGSSASGNVVMNDAIGVNANGTSAMPNGSNGITITNAGGGTAPTLVLSDIISGNTGGDPAQRLHDERGDPGEPDRNRPLGDRGAS